MATPSSSLIGQRKRARPDYTEPDDLEAEIYIPKTKVRRVGITGRSGSAPPTVVQNGKNVLVYLSGTPMPAFHHYITNISTHADWGDSTKKAIRLAYLALDPAKPTEMHGVYINDPAITGHTCTELPKHFEKIRQAMETNGKKTDATEATGEAAAAFAVCKVPTYAGFFMKWGAHVHAGAGLDQIWHKPTPADPAHPKGVYLIVEGKGVGATTATTIFGPPPAVQVQMSLGWVYHNLATMVRNNHQAAIDLMKDVGLEEELLNGGPYYANFGGVAKSYYSCKHTQGKQKARLEGLVVQGKWSAAGQLQATLTTYNYH